MLSRWLNDLFKIHSYVFGLQIRSLSGLSGKYSPGSFIVSELGWSILSSQTQIPLELSSHQLSCPEFPLLLSSWLCIYPKLDHHKITQVITQVLHHEKNFFFCGASLYSYVATPNSCTNNLWASFYFIFFLILFPWWFTGINLTLSEIRIVEQKFKKCTNDLMFVHNFSLKKVPNKI